MSSPEIQDPLKKRTRWQPKRYLEPPVPPPTDYRIEEEAAAQATALVAGVDGRRLRRFLNRRTVDLSSGVQRYKLKRVSATTVRNDDYLRPTPHDVIGILPPIAYREDVTSVAANLVHTSVNKVRTPINVVLWMPDERRLLTGSGSGEFTLWNAQTFNFETILQAHDSAIRAAVWSKSGHWMISSDHNGVIKYFQPNMNNLQVFQGAREGIRGLSFSPNDGRFVSASDDGTLKIWAFDDAREEGTLKGHGWDVRCCEWHPTKGLIVSGSKDNLVKFWDPRSGQNLSTLHGSKNTVQAVKWSYDGHIMAAASRDNFIRLYDIRAMKELHVLEGHTDGVCALSYHPHHTGLLTSSSLDGAMLHWSLSSSTPTAPIHTNSAAHDGNIWTLAWHPLGHLLASGSTDHATRFWQRARPGEGDVVGVGGLGDDEREKREKKKFAASMGGGDWGDEAIPGLRGPPPALPPPGLGVAPPVPRNDRASQDPYSFAIPGIGGASAGWQDSIPGLSNAASANQRPPPNLQRSESGGPPPFPGAPPLPYGFPAQQSQGQYGAPGGTSGYQNGRPPPPTGQAGEYGGQQYGYGGPPPPGAPPPPPYGTRGPVEPSRHATGVNGTLGGTVPRWGNKQA